MKNALTLFDEVLNKSLRPWLEENKPDGKYVTRTSELTTVNSEAGFLFQTKFYRPFNNKTTYYNKLLLNETISYIDHTLNLITEAETINEKKYWVNDTLNKKLRTILEKIGRVIKERHLDLQYIDPKKNTFDTDHDHKTDTYIIQLLKLCCIQIFMEIQSRFSDIYPDQNLILDDIYTRYLFETIPEEHFVTKIQVIEIKPKENPKRPKPKEANTHSFNYYEYSRYQGNLSDLFDNLKKNNFISIETTLPHFNKIFSGKEVKNLVRWTGNISELNYFIKCILPYMKPLKNNHWEVACKCFVDKEGLPFERKRLKDQKKPMSTYHLLDNAIKLL